MHPPFSPTPESCAHLRTPNPYTVALASFILLGILLSYLPQHLKIITHRSSAGLSPWWVLLGGLSCIAAIGNILVLPKSRQDVGCCKVVSGGECAAALLGVGQIGLQWGCFMFMLVIFSSTTTTSSSSLLDGWMDGRLLTVIYMSSVLLFLTFFPAENPTSTSDADPPSKPPTPSPRRPALIVGLTILTTLLLIGLTSTLTITAFPTLTQTWANFLGSVAGALAMIQWLPQIYATWRLKTIGSLSIITMLMQVPGSFLFALSLWLRVGWVGWSSWFVYLVTGTLQGVLLGLAVSYWFAGREEEGGVGSEGGGIGSSGEEEAHVAEAEEVTETTALLLSNGHSDTGGKVRPVASTKDSTGSQNKQSSMLYAATPPENDSEGSSNSGK